MADFQGAIKHLNAVIESEYRKLNLPGLSIGVTNREKTLFLGCFGLANCDTKSKITPLTLFQIGSISKSFTSILLLQLQEQGRITLDDLVTHHLPWFKIQSEYPPIRLHHLLSHTAGIIMGTDATTSAYTEIWNLRYTKTSAPPGEIFHYSNSDYKILGLVLKSYLKQDFPDILKERILIPLGMTNTEPMITNEIRDRLAVGYEAFYDDRPLPRSGKLAPAPWFESDTADGSISSTAEDMCCYLRFLLNHGQGILNPESFSRLIEPVIPTGDGLHGEMYALGLTIRKIEGNQVIGHSGGMVGYTADLLADLDAGLGVVALTNGPGNPDVLSQYILQLFRAVQVDEHFPESPFKDPYRVKNPHEYIGQYHCGGKAFVISSQKDHLYLESNGESILLEPQAKDIFIIPHPSLGKFLLRFGRGTNKPNDTNSQIIEAFHGSDWYINASYQREISFEIPQEWLAYTGHFQSHNPWLTNFRVVVQKNTLVLIDQWDAGETLHQIASARFRVGSEPRSPEFIEFDMIIDGKAMRANLSGGAYSRTFTT